MTDEQIAAAPRSIAVERMFELYKSREYDSVYPPDGELTQNIIAALQSDGQYIVFAAPEGYRFGTPRTWGEGDIFPSCSAISQTVIPIPVAEAKGITGVTLEKIEGGAE
jgi:hypothetical protein